MIAYRAQMSYILRVLGCPQEGKNPAQPCFASLPFDFFQFAFAVTQQRLFKFRPSAFPYPFSLSPHQERTLLSPYFPSTLSIPTPKLPIQHSSPTFKLLLRSTQTQLSRIPNPPRSLFMSIENLKVNGESFSLVSRVIVTSAGAFLKSLS